MLILQLGEAQRSRDLSESVHTYDRVWDCSPRQNHGYGDGRTIISHLRREIEARLDVSSCTEDPLWTHIGIHELNVDDLDFDLDLDLDRDCDRDLRLRLRFDLDLDLNLY